MLAISSLHIYKLHHRENTTLYVAMSFHLNGKVVWLLFVGHYMVVDALDPIIGNICVAAWNIFLDHVKVINMYG